MARIKVKKRHVAAAVAAAAILAGTALASTLASTHCHARGSLPDPGCTPGAVDSAVTQTNISRTICVSGYTATVRPTTTYTNRLKVVQMQQYGFTGNPSDYEEDHFIPLELGGNPSDPANLWPEPRQSIVKTGAESKDSVENALHRAVCDGSMTLAEARRRISTDWTTAAP